MNEKEIDPIVELIAMLSIILGRLNLGLAASTNMYIMTSMIKLHFDEVGPYLVFTGHGHIIKVTASILEEQPPSIAFSLPILPELFPQAGDN